MSGRGWYASGSVISSDLLTFVIYQQGLFYCFRRAGNGRRKSKRRKSGADDSSQHAGFDPNFDVQSKGELTPRRKVPSYMDRESPAATLLSSTPVIAWPKSIHVPRSPTVSPTYSTPTPALQNNPPTSCSDCFNDLRVHSSTYFELEISEDVFFDVEDGNTRNLSLSIMELYPSIASETWLKIDSSKYVAQYIFGVFPAYTESKPKVRIKFVSRNFTVDNTLAWYRRLSC